MATKKEARYSIGAQDSPRGSDWTKFARMLRDRHVPGADRRDRLDEERHEWLSQLEKEDLSTSDSQDAALWADLPASSDDYDSDYYAKEA